MSYIRIYPKKNATIFKDVLGGPNVRSGNINTGMNPIFELRDGNSNSIIVMQFDLSSILDLLNVYNFTCNLKMFDAGRQTDPLLKDLKPMNLFYFQEDFVEGDGFSFVEGNASAGVCNWNKRDTNNNWSPFSFGKTPAFQMNHVSDDISIDNLELFIENSISAGVNPNFALQLDSNTVSTEIYTKFIYSRHTRTIYKPYLEFFIDDVVLDNRDSLYATIPHRLHFLNLAGKDFVGTVTCDIKEVNGTVIESPTILNGGGGVYRVEYTPDYALAGKNIYDIWSIEGKPVKKNLIQVKSPNIISETDLSGLYFYPATYYQHPIINKGDKVKFNLISESRTKGTYISDNFEYRVVCTNGFELQPWQPVDVYNNKMSFIIDTSYYFEELEYEVSVRLKLADRIQTAASTYKFRVNFVAPTRLTGVAASPYDSRNIYLERNTN